MSSNDNHRYNATFTQNKLESRSMLKMQTSDVETRGAHGGAPLQTNPIILYDGVCALCNRLNQFLLKRDIHDRFRFASLQSEFATKVLRRHGADPDDLDTVYVIEDYETPNERLLARSDAILHVVRELGGFWKIAGWGKILPRPIRDALYKLVARNRYRVFGKYDTCMMPEPRYRKKFLD